MQANKDVQKKNEKSKNDIFLHVSGHAQPLILLPVMPAVGFSVFLPLCISLIPLTYLTSFHCRWCNKQAASV